MMKNKIFIGLLFGVGIIAVVIGVIFELKDQSKTEIICTFKEKSDTLTTHKRYILKFEDDNLKKYSKVFEYQYKDENKEEALRYKGEGIQKMVETSKNVPGVEISITEKDNTITNSYVYDLEIFDPQTSLEYSNVFPVYALNDSVTSIVEEIENWGFTCK